MENDTSAPAAAGSTEQIAVRDNEVEDQFELYVNGAPAGVLTYEFRDNCYSLNHTEIDPDFEGQGMGSKFVSRALDQIRPSGKGVIPRCPFVLSFLQRHAEYQDLVPSRYRSMFDLPR